MYRYIYFINCIHVLMTKNWILAMDLDGTLWNHLNISGVSPPYMRVDDASIKNNDNVIITLYKSALDFMKWAKSNGAIITSLSWNRTDYVNEALSKFGITELFDYHSTDYTPDKDQRLLKLIEKLKLSGIDITPDRIVYVDDRDIHMEAIRKNIGDIIFINIWKDIKNYDEAKKIVEDNILKTE